MNFINFGSWMSLRILSGTDFHTNIRQGQTPKCSEKCQKQQQKKSIQDSIGVS